MSEYAPYRGYEKLNIAVAGPEYDIKQVTRYVLVRKDHDPSAATPVETIDLAEFRRRDEAETVLKALRGDLPSRAEWAEESRKRNERILTSMFGPKPAEVRVNPHVRTEPKSIYGFDQWGR